MIEAFEQVALTEDLPDHHLMAGDVGTVVDISISGTVVTLEFFNFAGKTVAVVPVLREQVRRLGASDVLHTRAIAAS